MAELHTTSAALCFEAASPRLEEAERHLQGAEAALWGLDHPIERARLHLERARLALLQDHADDALDHARAARSLSDPDGMERARSELLAGRTLGAMGHRTEAGRAIEEAAARYLGLGAHRDVAECHQELGELALAEGDWPGAVEAFRHALQALHAAGLGGVAAARA